MDQDTLPPPPQDRGEFMLSRLKGASPTPFKVAGTERGLMELEFEVRSLLVPACFYSN